MGKLSQRAWDDILAHLRLNHQPVVRGWFTDLEPADIDTGALTIHAANDAQVRYLDRNARSAFLEAAQAATGRLIAVEFHANGQAGGHEGSGSAHALAALSDEIRLNPDFTFDNFVTGPSNRLAHAASLAVAGNPGVTYNPFFIHGGVGLGKTHLLQAIVRSVRERDEGLRCLYISCETFINHFIEAVERGALNEFRYRYRHVDLLVIDDIQFLAERERSQEEFFHTFNTLHQSQKQIVLSADCSPDEIPALEERLVSRFNSGLVALMERPCPETRMAIVRKKAKLRCIEVPEDVVALIANKVETNIRDLEGALIKLDAISQTGDGRITLELASEALGMRPRRSIKLPVLLDVVSRRFDVRIADLQGKKRSRTVTFPRHISMYLARQLTPMSLEEIGGYFGGRDHTTVLHAARNIAKQIETDPQLQSMLNDIANEARGSE